MMRITPVPERFDPRFFARTSRNRYKLQEDGTLEAFIERLEETDESERYPLEVQFFEVLLNSLLLLPLPQHSDPDHITALTTLEGAGGVVGLPVFTSKKALKLWVETQPELEWDYIGVPFNQICAHAIQSDVDLLLLNMGGPFGCEISHSDLIYLAEGLIPPPMENRDQGVCLPKGTSMRISKRTSLQPELTDRLQSLFKHHRELIECVYLFGAGFAEGPVKPALAIRVPEGSESQWEINMWPNLQAILQEMLETREYMDVFLLNEAPALEEELKDFTEPFYLQQAG